MYVKKKKANRMNIISKMTGIIIGEYSQPIASEIPLSILFYRDYYFIVVSDIPSSVFPQTSGISFHQ